MRKIVLFLAVAALSACLNNGTATATPTPTPQAQASPAPGGGLRQKDERPIPEGLLEDERNTISIFRRATDSVVYITTTTLRRDMFSPNVFEVPRGTGSGFVWDTAGHIVTNFHVVQAAVQAGGNGREKVQVTLADGTTHEAEIVGGDPNKDVAVLKIDLKGSTVTPVVAGESKTLVVGQKVLAIGNPFGLDFTLTTGIVSALGREIQSLAGTTIRDVIQTDAAINPGNSGGPLLDSRGRLIGINTAIYSRSGSSAGIGFAVPVDTVKRVVPELIQFGEVKRAGLGVLLIRDDIAARFGIQGVIIEQVLKGTPAARAGLRSSTMDRRGNVTLGDVIVAINDRPVTNYDDLYSALDGKKPGEEVRVRIRRGDSEQEVRLKLQALN